MNTKSTVAAFMASMLLGVSVSSLEAESFLRADGSQIEGEIALVGNQEATFATASGMVEAPFNDLDETALRSVEEWSQKNAGLCGVYSEWDVEPRIRASVVPELPARFRDEGFVGKVALDLVLNENGRVVRAYVHKSTHEELNELSIDATKSWRYEPAKVAGAKVKAHIRVLLKFDNHS